MNQLTKLGTYRRTNGYDGAAVAQFQPINQRFGGYHQIICLPVFPNNKEVTRSWVAVRAIFVYPLPPTVVKRQFRLGAVLTETAAEGFLLASVQCDAAGRETTPLAFERFDLAAARCGLDCAHRVFQCHPSRSTLQRLLNTIRRHREQRGGAR